jgi:hypothetical protein
VSIDEELADGEEEFGADDGFPLIFELSEDDDDDEGPADKPPAIGGYAVLRAQRNRLRAVVRALNESSNSDIQLRTESVAALVQLTLRAREKLREAGEQRQQQQQQQQQEQQQEQQHASDADAAADLDSCLDDVCDKVDEIVNSTPAEDAEEERTLLVDLYAYAIPCLVHLLYATFRYHWSRIRCRRQSANGGGDDNDEDGGSADGDDDDDEWDGHDAVQSVGTIIDLVLECHLRARDSPSREKPPAGQVPVRQLKNDVMAPLKLVRKALTAAHDAWLAKRQQQRARKKLARSYHRLDREERRRRTKNDERIVQRHNLIQEQLGYREQQQFRQQRWAAAAAAAAEQQTTSSAAAAAAAAGGGGGGGRGGERTAQGRVASSSRRVASGGAAESGRQRRPARSPPSSVREWGEAELEALITGLEKYTGELEL